MNEAWQRPPERQIRDELDSALMANEELERNTPDEVDEDQACHHNQEYGAAAETRAVREAVQDAQGSRAHCGWHIDNIDARAAAGNDREDVGRGRQVQIAHDELVPRTIRRKRRTGGEWARVEVVLLRIAGRAKMVLLARPWTDQVTSVDGVLDVVAIGGCI